MSLLRLLPILAISISFSHGSLDFINGRPRDGFLQDPPIDLKSVLDDPEITIGWFQQKLSHFNPLVWSSWKQKYMVNKKYYQPGGPMFVMIGGEGPFTGRFMDYGQWKLNAAKHGALMFGLEHRYYGDSHPTADMATENLRFLNSEEALADLAFFIETMRNQHGFQEAKVIVFGGSYPGNLAAWFRLKYPYIADGAIASSAPVWAKIDFYEYLETVGADMDSASPGCQSLVKEAFQEVDQMAVQNPDKTKEVFKLCQAVNLTDPFALLAFYQYFVTHWQYAAQYDKAGQVYMSELCNVMQNASLGTPLERFRSIYIPSESMPCHLVDPQEELKTLRNIHWLNNTYSSTRLWLYQTCTEFGYYQTTDSDEQPFVRTIPLALVEDFYCRQLFGIRPSTVTSAVNESNRIYGARKLLTSNVVLPNGSGDPWHRLGLINTTVPGLTPILIQGTSHCYDMYEERPGDPKSVTEAREKIGEEIDKIMKQ